MQLTAIDTIKKAKNPNNRIINKKSVGIEKTPYPTPKRGKVNISIKFNMYIYTLLKNSCFTHEFFNVIQLSYIIELMNAQNALLA